VATALAGLLVLFALIGPNQTVGFTPAAFLRIPLEALLAVAVLLALPRLAGRIVAVLIGVLLGVQTLLKFFDLGFFTTFARPFNPVFDWILFDDALNLVKGSVGEGGALVVLALIGVLLIGVPVLMTLSVLRLTRLAVQHDTITRRSVAGLTAVWVICAAFGVRIAPGLPVAADSAATNAYASAQQIRTGLHDRKAFANESAYDPYHETPGDVLLTALRGKDVIFAFVESYGRGALVDPDYATQINAVLDAGNQRLAASGFSAESAFLTSPTVGGGSWLTHATMLSGLWIDNEQRYRDLVDSRRLTLTRSFRAAGWRTVGVMPGLTRDWPEGDFYGYDQIYDSRNLGYLGRPFSWVSSVPDQYALSAFQRTERDQADRAPVMAEIDLTSSHEPWVPIPRMVDWNAVGDGTIFDPMTTEGATPQEVWRDTKRIRNEYRRSIEYSIETLISYVETYGDANTVLVMLGDHQPAPFVTYVGGRDVPISIIAKDRAVLDRISGWDWQSGIKPNAKAPVWRMDAFRDRFLTAYGPRPGQA